MAYVFRSFLEELDNNLNQQDCTGTMFLASMYKLEIIISINPLLIRT